MHPVIVHSWQLAQVVMTSDNKQHGMQTQTARDPSLLTAASAFSSRVIKHLTADYVESAFCAIVKLETDVDEVTAELFKAEYIVNI